MAISHRQDDLRVCGAGTVVVGQDFVKIDGKLWSVKGDPDSHGDGALQNSQNYVKIAGIYIILVGDHAAPDDLCIPLGPPHCDPASATGDALVVVN